jgi:hypothetical protein
VPEKLISDYNEKTIDKIGNPMYNKTVNKIYICVKERREQLCRHGGKA